MRGNLWVVLPMACLTGGAFAIYLVARLGRGRLHGARNALLAVLTALVFLLALGTCVPLVAAVEAGDSVCVFPAQQQLSAGAFLCADPGALVVMSVALGLGALVSIYSGRYMALDRRYETYYPLLLLLVVGLTGMVLAVDLFNLYLFCELMSVAAYVLVAFRRHTDTAIEAGFKYLIMGSVGTIAFLLGVSFVLRERGSLALSPLPVSGEGGALGTWGRAGLACMLIGLGIKSAIVPLHTWLPDAHGRAPSSVSAMLSGVVIQSAFYAMIKVALGLGFSASGLGALLMALALVNMVVGNALALVQTHTKRLLAYSTIAQMGYMMFSVGVGLRYRVPAAIQAGFFYLLAHAVVKGAAFLCKGACHFYCGSTTVSELRGVALRLPQVAIVMGVALGGLAALPPLAGFAGKWLILAAVVQSLDPFVLIGMTVFLLNSLLALGYYLPLIATLFTFQEPEPQRISLSPWMAVPLFALGGLIVAIGLYPNPWLNRILNIGTYFLIVE